MPRVYLDIEAAGSNVGSGPIVNFQNLSLAPELSRIGRGSFAMPAEDPKAQLLVRNRVARVWEIAPAGPVYRGAFVIRKIGRKLGSNGEILIEASGDDELTELTEAATFYVHGEGEPAARRPLEVHHLETAVVGMPEAYDENPATWIAKVLGPDRWIYILCKGLPIGLDITLSTVNTIAGNEVVQYFDGEGWTNYTFTANTCRVGFVPFAQSGVLRWDIVDTQRQVPHNLTTGLWIRMRVTDIDIDNIRWAEIKVLEPSNLADDVDSLLANDTLWATSAAFYTGTTSGSLIRGRGESVFEHLVRLAQRYGENFRAGSLPREIDWLRTDTPDSGLTAVPAAGQALRDLTAGQCLIEDLEILNESEGLVTRVFGFAAGQGDAATTFEHAVGLWSATGFSLGSVTDALGDTWYYMNNDTLEASEGKVIARRKDFREIEPIVGVSGGVSTALALADACHAYMLDNSDDQVEYKVKLTAVQTVLRVGDQLRVWYYKHDLEHNRIIDLQGTPLTIMSASASYDNESGLFSYNVKLSNIARHMQTDIDLLADEVQNLRAFTRGNQMLSSRALDGLPAGPASAGGGGAGGTSLPLHDIFAYHGGAGNAGELIGFPNTNELGKMNLDSDHFTRVGDTFSLTAPPQGGNGTSVDPDGVIDLLAPRTTSRDSINQADASGHEHLQELPVYPSTIIPGRIPVLSRNLTSPSSPTTVYFWDDPHYPDEALFSNGDTVIIPYYTDDLDIPTGPPTDDPPLIVGNANSGDGTTATTSKSVTNPGGFAVGDLLIIWIAIQSSTAVVTTPPSGFTQRSNTLNSNIRLYTYTKVATSGDVAAGSFSCTIDSAQGLLMWFAAVSPASGSTYEEINVESGVGIATAPNGGAAAAYSNSIGIMAVAIDSFSTDVNAPSGATKSGEIGINLTGDFISLALFYADDEDLASDGNWDAATTGSGRNSISSLIVVQGVQTPPSTTPGRGFVEVKGTLSSYSDLPDNEQSWTFTPISGYAGDGSTLVRAESPLVGFLEAQNNGAIIFSATGASTPYIMAAENPTPEDETARIPRITIGNLEFLTGNAGEIAMACDYIMFRDVGSEVFPTIPAGFLRLHLRNGNLRADDSGDTYTVDRTGF